MSVSAARGDGPGGDWIIGTREAGAQRDGGGGADGGIFIADGAEESGDGLFVSAVRDLSLTLCWLETRRRRRFVQRIRRDGTFPRLSAAHHLQSSQPFNAPN